MDFKTMGQRLRAARTRCGITQAEVAAAVGVRQNAYSRWERDARSAPAHVLHPLARALHIEVEHLQAVHIAARAGRPRKVAAVPLRKSSTLPQYKVQGNSADILRLYPWASEVLERARQRWSAAEMAKLERYFPRDSALELLSVFHCIALGARPLRTTLAALRCPVLVVDDWQSTRSGLYFLRDALILERPAATMVLIPQVWLVSVVQSEWYRVDFLCLVRGKKPTADSWAYVEIFGSGHGTTVEQDDRRARGISARRLVFWSRQVRSLTFGSELVRRLESLPHEKRQFTPL